MAEGKAKPEQGATRGTRQRRTARPSGAAPCSGKPGPDAHRGDTVPQRGSGSLGARGVARCMANRIRMSDGPSDNVRRGADAEIRVKPGGMSGRKLRRRHVPGGEH